ncbi:hypothetical protein EB810_13720 [Altererythrobacter sp. FM1]|uniref:hypothetical protein n=1 Tax=Tsuneonella flava TaxID=2055955 RepID=UPI000C805F0A|nr:hypothetical protein [Tsuneonella flava]ROT94124.1 hypothetical protein EB810_13720 [Altererythrobacter sp. FM1]
MAKSRKGASSLRGNFIGILAVLAAFIFVYLVSNAEKALASAVVLGVFLTIIQTKSETRKESLADWRFWSVIAGLALIHIIAIAVINFPELRAGLISLPFALVDGFLMWWFLNWFERRFLSGNGDKAR